MSRAPGLMRALVLVWALVGALGLGFGGCTFTDPRPVYHTATVATDGHP
ncbi:MAG: hypothetical protein HY216_11860, partial [Candidatus Rokubacteria bacterium]|nr:hypothetical protein [Candidatus Rokubacteria bacterium]